MVSRQVIAFTAIALIAASIASADPRPFTFTTDTYPVGKGNWEYEQWITWQQTGDENSYRFRHEIEVGIADNFDLAVYLPNWRYEDTQDRSGPNFDSVGIEGVVYFLNPVTDFIGLGLYNELTVGEDALEFEHKILIQKDVGNWIFAYNLVLETEIEGVFDANEENEVTGVLEHTFGASYGFGRGDVRVGAELVVESEYADWDEYEGTSVYAGPVFSYWGGKNFWFTVTPTYQLTSNDEEADFNVRMIAGLSF
jgi:hypothetical protein